MKKIDKTVKKETLYIAVFSVILSALMQAVFLVIGKWDYTVLLGNLLSLAVSVLNFFLMGVTVQNATAKDEKQAANTMKLSQSFRMIMIFITALVGVLLNCFNTITVLVPLFFTRIAVMFRPVIDKKNNKNKDIQDN